MYFIYYFEQTKVCVSQKMEYTVAMNGGDGPDSYTRNSKIQVFDFYEPAHRSNNLLAQTDKLIMHRYV